MSLTGRPWIGVLFNCCDTYGRAYLDRDGVHFRAQCPRCGRLQLVHPSQARQA